MTKDNFKKFWEMIPKSNQSEFKLPTIYQGFMFRGDLADAIIEAFIANNFQV